jgi:hypothetical protein
MRGVGKARRREDANAAHFVRLRLEISAQVRSVNDDHQRERSRDAGRVIATTRAAIGIHHVLVLASYLWPRWGFEKHSSSADLALTPQAIDDRRVAAEKRRAGDASLCG